MCPPKNTFTSLNYDLVMAVNATMDEKTRRELTNFAVKNIYENELQKTLQFENRFGEENKPRNWYLGISKPSVYYTTSNGILNFKLYTSASSGSLVTPCWGEPYNTEAYFAKIQYKVYIFPPKTSEPIVLVLKILGDTKETPGGSDKILTPNEKFQYTGHFTKSENKIIYPNQTETISVTYFRNLLQGDIQGWKSIRETGMRLTWYYEDNFGNILYKDQTYAPQSKPDGTEGFVRLANILFRLGNDVEILKDMKKFKELWVKNQDIKSTDGCEKGLVKNEMIGKLMTTLEQNLKLDPMLDPTFKDNFGSTLRTAVELYIYLFSCPKKDNQWGQFYADLFARYPMNTIIVTLMNVRAILAKNNNIGDSLVVEKLLNKFENKSLKAVLFGNYTTQKEHLISFGK